MTDLAIETMTYIGENFGLLPLYTLIVGYMGWSARNGKHLTFMLGIACGVYTAMFKAFNLKAQFGPLDPTQYLPIPPEVGNVLMAWAFVYGAGFAVYAARRAWMPQNAEEA